jgi:hypothetical protein
MEIINLRPLVNLPNVIIDATIKNSNNLDKITDVDVDILTERMNKYFKSELNQYTLNDYDSTFLSFILCLLYDFNPMCDYLIDLLVKLGKINDNEKEGVSEMLKKMSEGATNANLGIEFEVLKDGQQGGAGISIISLLGFLLSTAFIIYTIMYNRQQYFNPVYPQLLNRMKMSVGVSRALFDTAINKQNDCGIIPIPTEVKIMSKTLEMIGLESLFNSSFEELYSIMVCNQHTFETKLYSYEGLGNNKMFNDPTEIFDYVNAETTDTSMSNALVSFNQPIDDFASVALTIVPDSMLSSMQLSKQDVQSIIQNLDGIKQEIKSVFEDIQTKLNNNPGNIDNALVTLDYYANMKPDIFIKKAKSKKFSSKAQDDEVMEDKEQPQIQLIEEPSQFQKVVNTVSSLTSIGYLVAELFKEIKDTSSQAFAVNLNDQILWTFQDYLMKKYVELQHQKIDTEAAIGKVSTDIGRILTNLNAFFNMVTMFAFLNTISSGIILYYLNKLYNKILVIRQGNPRQQQVITSGTQRSMAEQIDSILGEPLGQQLLRRTVTEPALFSRQQSRQLLTLPRGQPAQITENDSETLEGAELLMGMRNVPTDDINGGYKRKQKNRTAKKIKRKTRKLNSRHSKGRNTKGRNTKGRKSKRRN